MTIQAPTQQEIKEKLNQLSTAELIEVAETAAEMASYYTDLYEEAETIIESRDPNKPEQLNLFQ